MYLQNLNRNIFFQLSFLLASWRSVTKIAGSGSISQRHGSADPNPDPPKMSWIGNTAFFNSQELREPYLMVCVCAGPDPRVFWWPQTWRPAVWTWTTSSLSSTTIIPTTARTTSTGLVRYLLSSIRCIWRLVLSGNIVLIRDGIPHKKQGGNLVC